MAYMAYETYETYDSHFKDIAVHSRLYEMTTWEVEGRRYIWRIWHMRHMRHMTVTSRT